MPQLAHVGPFAFTVAVRVAIAVLLSLGWSSLLAAPSREEYELQERCGKRATELFLREWGKEGVQEDGKTTARYRSNYNAQLNRCFVLYTVRSLATRPSTQLTLFEANTNKDYGFYFSFDTEPRSMDCWVAERKCQSRQEWESLAARFLGD